MNDIEYNKKLLQKMPWLKPYNIWTGKELEDYDYSFTLMDDIPIGWRKAFGEIMIKEIQEYLEEHDLVDKYVIQEIKEKFGQLRWYTNICIEDIETKYEVISEHVCICCGRLDVPIVNVHGWLSPYCPDCYYNILKKYGCTVTDVVKAYSICDYDKEWKIPDRYFTTRHDCGNEIIEEHDISKTVNKIREYNNDTDQIN